MRDARCESGESDALIHILADVLQAEKRFQINSYYSYCTRSSPPWGIWQIALSILHSKVVF